MTTAVCHHCGRRVQAASSTLLTHYNDTGIWCLGGGQRVRIDAQRDGWKK